jgi:hypothetical protein
VLASLFVLASAFTSYFWGCKRDKVEIDRVYQLSRKASKLLLGDRGGEQTTPDM